MYNVLRFLVFIACASSASAGVLNGYPFRVETQPFGAMEQVLARNDGPAPVTLHVTLKSRNLASTAEFPQTLVVPAASAVRLAYVSASDPAEPHRYVFNYTYYVGRLDAVHDAGALYRYPFPDGQSHAITQAEVGRLTSHDNKQNRYAVDFDMPEGTPVLAARAGVVVDVVLRYDRGGTDRSLLDRANTVMIAHDDGTLAEYAHLAQGAPLVSVGERVGAGRLIGYSGNTGYSSGPHLHFVVSKPFVEDGQVMRMSLPVRFYADRTHAPLTPRAGTIASADYRDATPDAAAEAHAARGAMEAVPLANVPLTAQGSTSRQ